MEDMILINGAMPESTPEAQGVPSWAITNFFKRMKQENIEMHSFQMIRNGKLIASAVAAPYTMKSFHRIFSSAKGVVATGVLFCIQEGYFGLHDLVLPKLPKEWLPEELDERWNRLTIYHLLTMNTGHDCDTLFQMWGKSDCWIKTFFEVAPAYEPGTFFRYDMGAQYVMNELVRLATGKDMGEYLKPRLFEPLGLEFTNNYTEPEHLFFSSSIQLHPDGLTKLALFYLQQGSWEGKQLLNKELAIMAGLHHSPSNHYRDTASGQPDSNSGYAFHMWRNRVGGFRFSGGQGQFGIVLPDQNIAVGIMAAEHKNRRILDVFFEEVFPHLYLMPKAENDEAYQEMKAICQNFTLAPDVNMAHTEIERSVSEVNYSFQENPVKQEHIKFVFKDTEILIVSEREKKQTIFSCGLEGEWKKTVAADYLLTVTKPETIPDLDRNFYYNTNEVWMTGGWQTEDTFVFSLRSAALLCGYTFSCQFSREGILITLPPHATQPRNNCDPNHTTILMSKSLSL